MSRVAAALLCAIAVLVTTATPAEARRPATARERAILLPLVTQLPRCAHRYMAVQISTVQGSRIAAAWQQRRPPASCFQGDGYVLFARARVGKPWKRWYENGGGEACGTRWELSFLDLLDSCNAGEGEPRALPVARTAVTSCGLIDDPFDAAKRYDIHVIRNRPLVREVGAPGRIGCFDAQQLILQVERQTLPDDTLWVPLKTMFGEWTTIVSSYHGRVVVAAVHEDKPAEPAA